MINLLVKHKILSHSTLSILPEWWKKKKSLKILKCKKSKQDQVQVPEQEEKVILLWNIY